METSRKRERREQHNMKTPLGAHTCVSCILRRFRRRFRGGSARFRAVSFIFPWEFYEPTVLVVFSFTSRRFLSFFSFFFREITVISDIKSGSRFRTTVTHTGANSASTFDIPENRGSRLLLAGLWVRAPNFSKNPTAKNCEANKPQDVS